MYSKITQNKYSLSLYLFSIAIVFVYLDFLRATFDERGEVFGSLFRMISISVGPFLLLLSTIAALLEGQLRRISRKYQIWIICLIFVFFGLLFNGLVIHQNSFRLIVLDTILFLFFLPGILIGSKKENWIVIDKIILAIFFINVINLVPYIGAYINIVDAIRGSIITGYDQIPYFFWGQLAIWPYLFLTMDSRSSFEKYLIIVGIILFFYFALIFLKRAPFVYLFAFIFLLFISNRSQFKITMNYKSISFVFIAIVFSISLFKTMELSSMLERLGDRFSSQGTVVSTLLTSNRLTYDINLVREQLSGAEYIMGRGLGGVVTDHGYNYPELMTSTLHNSSAQLVLKGGFFMLIVWFFGWLSLIKDFLFNHKHEYIKYYLPVVVPVLFSWVFGFLSTTVYFLLITLCTGMVISKERFENQ